MTRLVNNVMACLAPRLALGLGLALAACDGGSSTPSPDAGSPDAGNVPPPPIERAQAGGDPGAIARAGDLVYVTVGPRLALWNVANAGAPVQLGESEPFDGVLTGVAVQGRHAFVTDRTGSLDGHLHIIDVSTPAAPKTVATLRVAASGQHTEPLAVVVDGTRAFVADREHGVVVVDVSDPAHPALVRTIDSGGVTGLQVVGTRLYTMAQSLFGNSFTIEVFDLGSAELARLGGTTLPTGNGLAITGNHVAVAVGTLGLQMSDLSDPAHPVPVPSQANIAARTVVGGATGAYVPAFDGLWKIDLSAHEPVISGPATLPIGGSNTGIAVGDQLTIVTDRGRMVVIDVAAATPATRSDVDVSLAAEAIGVCTVGDRIFVAGGAGGLRTGRLRDLATAGRGFPSGNIDFEDVVVDGNTAYVADWFFGLRVFDVSDPAEPKPIATLGTAGAPAAIGYHDHKVYMGDSTGGGALRVIDVSDPSHPVEKGSVTTSKVWDLQVVGDKVYTSDETLEGPGGLRIWNVSDPGAPRLAGEYTGCTDVRGVTVIGTVAVIGCSDEAQVIDVANASAPKRVGTLKLPEPTSIWTLANDGKRVYVGHDRGVAVLDVRDPAAPKLLKELPTSYTVRGLTVPVPGRVIASAGLAGVFQWDVP
jgi:hypothetical protein